MLKQRHLENLSKHLEGLLQIFNGILSIQKKKKKKIYWQILHYLC